MKTKNKEKGKLDLFVMKPPIIQGSPKVEKYKPNFIILNNMTENQDKQDQEPVSEVDS